MRDLAYELAWTVGIVLTVESVVTLRESAHVRRDLVVVIVEEEAEAVTEMTGLLTDNTRTIDMIAIVVVTVGVAETARRRRHHTEAEVGGRIMTRRRRRHTTTACRRRTPTGRHAMLLIPRRLIATQGMLLVAA